MAKARYRIVEKSEETFLIKDDGYRIWAKILETNKLGESYLEYKSDWLHVMEYKHCDFGSIADMVVDLLFEGSKNE